MSTHTQICCSTKPKLGQATDQGSNSAATLSSKVESAGKRTGSPRLMHWGQWIYLGYRGKVRRGEERFPFEHNILKDISFKENGKIRRLEDA